jgi:two-component system NtrC family sensor kinase
VIQLSSQPNRRVLVIDDNHAIHEDFRHILCVETPGVALHDLESTLLGDDAKTVGPERFEVDSAFQGEEGLAMVQAAMLEGRPYAMAFVDMRMSSGWDGVDTVSRIWKDYPELEVVICTAHVDDSWDDTIASLGRTDKLLILKQPFDRVVVRQLASSLTAKWSLAQQVDREVRELESTIVTRNNELERQKSSLEDALGKLQRTQSQLFQADKLASIGQLAAGIAHEINNPMGFISSNLNSLGHYVQDVRAVLAAYEHLLDESQRFSDLTPLSEEVRRVCVEKDIAYILSDLDNLVSESVEGAQRVRQIVADLRDFSHINSPQAGPEDLNDLLDKTINVAWNELKYRTKLVREYSDIPAVMCYGGKLAQVFLNLLVNAAQAIEEHGTITIRTGQDEAFVWVEVSDTGCGIPQENLHRIFDPFFTTKEVGKGTGLGLHLAYTTVQAHEGRIQVQSEPGIGSTFRIELPISGPASVLEVEHESAQRSQ